MSPVQPRTPNGPLPLLCALGRHKTDLLVRWNDGYYFTQCRRCGLDLVRTAFSGWTAPKRYRVVWQSEPPAASHEERPVPADAGVQFAADAAPEATASGQERGQVEFPIRDAADGPLGLSMTEEAFAARPAVEPAEDSFTGDSRADRAATGKTASLQGRKDGVGGLPIEDVLRNLKTGSETNEPGRPAMAVDATARHDAEHEDGDDHDGESLQAAPPPAAPQAPPQPVRAKYPVIPDFMDEDFPGITWDPSTGKMIPGAQGHAEDAPREAKPGWREAIRERAHAATATGLEFIRARPSGATSVREPVAEAPPHPAIPPHLATPPHPATLPQPAMPPHPATPPRSFLERQGGLVAATIFGGFVLAAAIVDARSSEPARYAYRPELRSADVQDLPGSGARASDQRTASVAGRPSAGGEQAFVTASLLNCRAVPTNDGETVRRLSRGDAVQVLGADPGWVSVSHQGRQCWASSEWISTVKPL